jgi:hypothetical protein
LPHLTAKLHAMKEKYMAPAPPSSSDMKVLWLTAIATSRWFLYKLTVGCNFFFCILMLLILSNIALIVRSVSNLHALFVHSSPGQKLGFLICWNVEHGCVAHALKLLF